MALFSLLTILLFHQNVEATPSFPIYMKTPNLVVLQMPQMTGLPQGVDPLSIILAASIVSLLQTYLMVILVEKDLGIAALAIGFSLGLGGIAFGIVGSFVALPIVWSVASMICLALGIGLAAYTGILLIQKIFSKQPAISPTTQPISTTTKFSSFVPTMQISF
jgi:hypothetical protein